MNTLLRQVASFILICGIVMTNSTLHLLAQSNQIVPEPDFITIMRGDKSAGMIEVLLNDTLPANKEMYLNAFFVSDDEVNLMKEDARNRGWIPNNSIDPVLYTKDILLTNADGGVWKGYFSGPAHEAPEWILYPYSVCESDGTGWYIHTTCVNTYALIHYVGTVNEERTWGDYNNVMNVRDDEVIGVYGDSYSLTANDDVSNQNRGDSIAMNNLWRYAYFVEDTPAFMYIPNDPFGESQKSIALSHYSEILPGNPFLMDGILAKKVPGITLNSNGMLYIGPDATPGVYNLTYRVCMQYMDTYNDGGDPGQEVDVPTAKCGYGKLRLNILDPYDGVTPPVIVAPSPLPDVTVEANDDVINITRAVDTETKEVQVNILQNDLIRHELNGNIVPTPTNTTITLGNISLTGAELRGDEIFYIPAGKYATGVYTIPYTLCTVEDDDMPSVCDDANIIINVALESAPILPPSPKIPTPSNPSSGGGGGGGGGYVPSNPKTPNSPGVPLFSAPIIDNQCVSHVKNLDDPKLIEYYNVLKVQQKELVHRPITRAEFVKLITNAAHVNVASIDTGILNDFTDIDTAAWYAPYIAYTFGNNIVSGQEVINTKDNTTKRVFRPNDYISRAEAAKIFIGLLVDKVHSLPTGDQITTFADVSSSHTLAPYIQESYNSCLLHGRNTIDGKPLNNEPRRFEPQDVITLAEVSKVLYNMTHQEK